MYVVKRDGRQETVHFDKITARLKKLSYGLNTEHCDPVIVAQKVCAGVYKGVTTTLLDELAAETAAAMTANHPDYASLAARIVVSNLHKNTRKSFSETIKEMYNHFNERSGLKAPLVADDVYEIIMKNAARLDSEIIYDRDFDYDYFGFKTLERSYLLKVSGKVVERPQHMLMRVAVGIHKDDIESAIKTYHFMSQRWFTHASPTLFNAGTPRPQVHITQGDHVGKAVIVSWTTVDEPGSNTVTYWGEFSDKKETAEGVVRTYKFVNYTSGYIHHCTISGLEFDSKYYYEVGTGNSSRRFWFLTPPESGPDVPYTFGLIGDLGQTYDSNMTLTHYEMNPTQGKALLFVGDLSYADRYPNHDNVRWDTWGRFVERNAAYQPWIWSAGNHEIDFIPTLGETQPFKPYTNRFPTPYRASHSTSPYWYSIKRASAYVIVMASYSAFGMYTPQYKWLMDELPKVNRTETPWLIVVMHCPMYSSYVHHYMEGETMRVMYEPYFVKYKVDVIFAGHVHAYERSERISNIAYNITNGLCTPTRDTSAPVYITIGDGGNSEGLLYDMVQPQPEYSAYREPSFGHGTFDIKNRTHAHFAWHRNQDGYAVEADSLWLHNRYWNPTKDVPVASM